MILPPPDGGEPPDDFIAKVERWFGAEGPLCARAEDGFVYEDRPQQRRMAEAVARAIATGRHLMVEAGTGVGKSFAYLVPLILAAMERHLRGVVSTWTISLQEQLIHKDLPFLQKRMGDSFTAALMIGRTNYLCPKRLAHALKSVGTLFPDEEAHWLQWLSSWAAECSEGTLQEMPRQPPPSVWESVCSEDESCRGRRCPMRKECFYAKARDQVARADLLVVNHHLLMADLAMRLDRHALLPEHGVVVIDEAHQLEHVASDHFGIHLSEFAFDRLLRRLWTPDLRRGLLHAVKADEEGRQVERIAEEVERLFVELREVAGPADDGAPRRLRQPPAVDTDVDARLHDLARSLHRLKATQPDSDLRAELNQAAQRAKSLAERLGAFLRQEGADHVYWTEFAGRRQHLWLRSAPIEVGPVLRTALFGPGRVAVLTSATLSAGGDFAYLQSRIGADNGDTLSVGSPFDHARQMRVRIARRLPLPTDSEFTAAAADLVVRLAIRNRGGTLALFTNAKTLREFAVRTRPAIESADLRLLVQGEGMSRRMLLDEFRGGGGMVLFGLDSFWMGVDVPGDALTQVIIVRLPFPVPDDPVTEARIERIRERGGDPFRELTLPAAVIKFRQGVGRLIRTACDTGSVVVLDRRIVDRWYGRWFLDALPECPVQPLEEDDELD